jgi:hypothetical protein
MAFMTGDGSYRLGIRERSARIQDGSPAASSSRGSESLRSRPALGSCLVQVRSTAPGTEVAKSIHERPPAKGPERESREEKSFQERRPRAGSPLEEERGSGA